MKRFIKKNGQYLTIFLLIIFIVGHDTWIDKIGETLYMALAFGIFAVLIYFLLFLPFIEHFLDKKQDSDEVDKKQYSDEEKNSKTSQFNASISSELKKLHELYDKGVLDKDEFKIAKEKILKK